MKLCKKNIQKDNSSWQDQEPDDHFTNRQIILVEDSFDFNANNDEDVTGDVRYWNDHYQRLGINYYHFLKIVQGIIIPKCNPNYPTIDYSGMGNLSEDELEFGVKYHVFFVTSLRRIDGTNDQAYQVSEDVDISNWVQLLDFSRTGRSNIVELMRTEVGKLIPEGLFDMAGSDLFYSDTKDIIDYYVGTANKRFESFMNDASVTIDGETYDYTLTGFSSKGYFSQDVKDVVLSVYYGNHYI